ncbi:MAG: 50S ribosomal protein L23 [Candidatus Paceibacterota bacterium]|jgi:large subunit ribosomal protein L23
MKNEKIDYKALIKRPRITEKSGIKSESENVYTFEVANRATKQGIIKAIREIYKVNPVKVNITILHAKEVFARGKSGIKTGVKKAVVFFKKGDKIAFI